MANSTAILTQAPDGAPVARVLALLNDVRRTSRGWSARCPAHDDSRPSLAIAIGRDERVLLTCRSGCRADEVLKALGLPWGALFAHERERTPRPRPTSPLMAARLGVLDEALRQAWNREGVLDLYLAADVLKLVDRTRESIRDESEPAWELLGRLANLETDAEALWAESIS